MATTRSAAAALAGLSARQAQAFHLFLAPTAESVTARSAHSVRRAAAVSWAPVVAARAQAHAEE